MPQHAPKGPVKGDPMDAPSLMETASSVKPYVTCTATSKQSGQRCKRRPIPGGTVCIMHGGGAPNVQFAAQQRLKALQPKAITTLETLLDRDEFPTVQMAAVRDVLDRTEGKAPETQNVTVTASVSIVDILKQRHAKQKKAE